VVDNDIIKIFILKVMLESIKNVLVLAPHTDDGEIGCGGLISKLIDMGKTVSYVAFSTCEESVPNHLPSDILETEVKLATKVLGINESNLYIYKFPVRYFPTHRQEILEVMVSLNKDIKPDLVLLPMSTEIHQDHSVINKEGIRAFKKTTILGYELVWNNLTLNNNLFIKLDPNNIDKKIESISQYGSQKFREYMTPEYIKSLARVRGMQINCEFSETFEIIRMIL
jgi:LmbE family N-acetylglucosaminyl deacetylase